MIRFGLFILTALGAISLSNERPPLLWRAKLSCRIHPNWGMSLATSLRNEAMSLDNGLRTPGAKMLDAPNYHDSTVPRVVVVADSDEEREALSAVVDSAGCAVKDALDLRRATQWFRDDRPADLLLLSLHNAERLTESMLLEARELTNRQKIPLIATAPIEMIDGLYSILGDEQATLLCSADASELVAAIAIATHQKTLVFSDVTGDMDSQRLRRLADEVSRIARTLASLSGPQAPTQGYASSIVSDFQAGFRHEPDALAPVETLPEAEEIRRLLRLRRLRDSFFDSSLFADPAWDILLDLAAARKEHAQVAVSSLCIAAAVPPTTALRWIKAMTDHGLLERIADPGDGRRIFIQLSDSATANLGRYFEATRKIGGVVI